MDPYEWKCPLYNKAFMYSGTLDGYLIYVRNYCHHRDDVATSAAVKAVV